MNSRSDILTAQHLQVALVYKQMLGMEEAEAYLRKVGIPSHLVRRILHSDDHRPLAPSFHGRSDGHTGSR